MAKSKVPLGVEPFGLWQVRVPNPTIVQLTERYAAVGAAVGRYREAGLAPQAAWLCETGLDRFVSVSDLRNLSTLS